MDSINHSSEVLSYLNRDPLKHIVQLKMLSAYYRYIKSFYLTKGPAAGVLLLLPTRVTTFDAATYPSTAYVVLIATDAPAVTELALECIPGNCKLIFKLINRPDKAVVERKFPIEYVASYISYTCNDDIRATYSDKIAVSNTLEADLLPLFGKNGYEREELEQYFNSGKALAFSMTGSNGPVSTCFAYQNHGDIWEIAGLYTEVTFQRRGYARQVVAVALKTLLLNKYVPRYQVLATNLPSIKLAQDMGLKKFLVTEHYLTR